MPRRALTILSCLALAAGTAFAGCGDDDDEPATPAPPAAEAPATTEAPEASANGDEVAVGIKDIKFVPEEITAKVGQKIVWTNNEAIGHDVTATDGADFKSDTLQEGDTFEFTPTEAGEIAYVCTLHNGQNGSITVTE
jgi:plastocyanin